MFRRTKTLAATFCLALAVTACGSDGAEPEAGDGNTKTGGSRAPIAAPAAPAGAAVTIVAPAANATVGTDVELRVRVKGFKLGGADVEKGRILVAFIDKEPMLGERIPRGDDSIRRFRRGSVVLDGLAPGKHTVTVVAANVRGVALEPVVQDTVTFTVDPAVKASSAQPAASPTS